MSIPSVGQGEQPQRALRPVLLILKVISLSVLLGSYVSAGVLWFGFVDDGADGAAWSVRAVSVLFRFVVVPSLITTIILGLVLLLQQPRVLLRQRWLQIKLVLLVALFAIHFFARPAFLAVKAARLQDDAAIQESVANAASRRFSICLLLGLICALLIMLLGRCKPALRAKSHR